ncbi:hypothetical protein QE152_g32483 [Popillia japonica]|uniref:SWIM-type domain-containing protein n=1 Tax=Popillia japonica TaxID=7064 RepID=A0AAW1IZ66_POPJA
MGRKHFLKLSMFANFFDTKQLQRCENAAESGHIIQMATDLNKSPAILTGKVTASMKNKTYDIEMHIDKKDGIVKGTCACPRGLVSCHHMVALCTYARDNVSVTDTQCSWNIPKPGKDDNVQTLEDLYLRRRVDYLA